METGDARPVDLERVNAGNSALPSSKQNIEVPKVVKPNHLPKSVAKSISKRDIIESMKSMEQQNIDLAASKLVATSNANQINEWNVIKKGKKVKVVKDIKTESEVQDNKTKEELNIVEVEISPVAMVDTPKKASYNIVQQKPKKSKNKSKKKKPLHLLVKQNGFEIIEPTFNSTAKIDEEKQEISDDEPEITDLEIINVSSEIFKEFFLNPGIESQIVTNTKFDRTPESNDLNMTARKIFDYDDDIIDISDEDFCYKSSIPVEMLVKEVHKKLYEPEVTKKVVPEFQYTSESLPENFTKIEIFETSEAEHVLKDYSEKELFKKPQSELQISNGTELKLEMLVEAQNATQHDVLNKPEACKTKSAVSNDKLDECLKLTENQLTQPEAMKNQVEGKKKTVAKRAQITNIQSPDPRIGPLIDNSSRTNIAALERDLIENLRQFDDDFNLKSPIINPLFDFPITSAVRKWLQEKQNESFDSLFHIQNLKKLTELYDNNDEDNDDETESDISEKEPKSESDSDYGSDFQAKANDSSPMSSRNAKGSSSKCSKLIAKESFCALM